MEKLPKVTATFNNEGTEVTIAVEGQEGTKTFTTKLSAINYGRQLLDSKKVDQNSLWEMREVIIAAENLSDATDEEKKEQMKMLENELGLVGLIGLMGGGVGITVIEVSMSNSGRKSKDEPANDTVKIMKNPVFSVCKRCGSHGNFEDEDSNGKSQNIHTKEAAHSWIQWAKERGSIKPEDAQRLTEEINTIEKLPDQKTFIENMDKMFSDAQ